MVYNIVCRCNGSYNYDYYTLHWCWIWPMWDFLVKLIPYLVLFLLLSFLIRENCLLFTYLYFSCKVSHWDTIHFLIYITELVHLKLSSNCLMLLFVLLVIFCHLYNYILGLCYFGIYAALHFDISRLDIWWCFICI